MGKYLLFESRDPFDSNDTGFVGDLATGLVAKGHEVTVYLVQNGVLPARRCGASATLTALSNTGVSVVADGFSLRERGIDAGNLADGVSAAELDSALDALADGATSIWH